jgi:hypothetical protein
MTSPFDLKIIARILEIESNSKYKKYKESARMACSANPISQPSLDISPIWIPSSVMRFLTDREDLYDVTDSSWVSIRFQSRVFRFYSTDGASGRYYMCSNFFPFLCIGAHSFGFVTRLVAQISNSFSILVPRMCVLYHTFYCILFCHFPSN